MKRILLVICCCLSLLNCSAKNDSQKEIEFKPGELFIAVEKARTSKPVDISAIDSIYSGNLASFIKTVDSGSDSEITGAIVKARKNESLHVQTQIICKTIQKVFFNEIVKLLSSLKNESDKVVYKSTIDKINEYYEVLSPTVIRRGEWIGKNRELEDICRMQLVSLKESFGNSTLEISINTLEKTLKEVYTLSVLYELVGIAENRGKDAKKCEEKVAEGRIFFETVEQFAEDSSLKNAIKASFETDYMNMDVEKTKEMVGKVFAFDIPDVAR